MLEVKLLISDLDYDGVVDLVVPAVAKKLRTRKGIRTSGTGLWRIWPRRSAV